MAEDRLLVKEALHIQMTPVEERFNRDRGLEALVLMLTSLETFPQLFFIYKNKELLIELHFILHDGIISSPNNP